MLGSEIRTGDRATAAPVPSADELSLAPRREMKVKCENREELVVAGWTDSEGARPWSGLCSWSYYDPGAEPTSTLVALLQHAPDECETAHFPPKRAARRP